MHTYQEKTHTFHFNSDFSGEVVIVANNEPETEMTVPAEALLNLIAYYFVLPQKVHSIENMTARQLLSE